MVHDDVMSRVTIEIDDERVTAAQRMHRPDWKRIMAPVGRMRRSRAQVIRTHCRRHPEPSL
ncbi:hypothetical protein B1987_01100 [Mycobacterium kansasii]|nr:hypothetical protein B1987_01100 [Mycobacterium kansasii]